MSELFVHANKHFTSNLKIQNYFVYSKISSNIVSNCNYPSNSNNSFSIENEQKSEQTNTVSINRTNEFSQQYDGAKKIRFLIKIHARRNVRLHAVYISFPFKRLQFFLFFLISFLHARTIILFPKSADSILRITC